MNPFRNLPGVYDEGVLGGFLRGALESAAEPAPAASDEDGEKAPPPLPPHVFHTARNAFAGVERERSQTVLI